MKLNKAQTEAVFCDDKRILCLAGAGTGKTASMIERITRLTNSGVDPTSILALTFTNAAAFEMRARFKKSNPNIAIPEFRTFHSFCYSLLATNKALRLKLGYTAMPAIADSAAQKRIDKEAGMQVGIQLSQKKLSGKEAMTELEKHNYNILKKAAERLMKKENVITFDILCRSVCQLFIDNDEMIQCYKDRYKYLFVDEFQDTDQTQWKFVQSFAAADVFVVGDAQQAVYSFRGADSSIIKSLAENKDWTTIKLVENYRSTKPICDYANVFTRGYVKDSYRIEIESLRVGDKVETRHDKYSRLLDRGDISEKLLDEVKNEIVISEGGVAILCRTNAEVSCICDYLKDKNIDFVTGKQDEEAGHIMKSAMDDGYMIDWLATFLNAERYSEYIRRSTIANESGEPYVLGDFIHDFGWAKAVGDRADKIYCIRRICRENRPLDARCRDILKLIGYPRLNVNLSGCKKLYEFLAAITDAVESQTNNAAYIYVGTIHSVKGLEYENVYVMGVGGKSFRLTNEENNNLFYVAVTRAKKHLVVYFADA